jgi:hypothetical protein
VLVPSLEQMPAAVADERVADAATEPGAVSIAAVVDAAVDIDELESQPRLASQRRKHNYFGWIVPLACMGVLAAIGSFLLRRPPEKLEGTIVGERLTDIELAPFRVDNRRLGRTKLEAQPILENLESSPVRAGTPSLILEFKGVAGGIEVSLRTAGRAELFRVDPAKSKRLAEFIDDYKQEFRAAVDATLDESVPRFLKAVEKRTERDREVEGLADLRDTVGLASLMRASGFGYYVQATIGNQAYPCVHEDNQGRLFFALPDDTQEFELVGRDRPRTSGQDAPRFPGRYTVRISEQATTITPDAPDGNEKVRKALKK